MSAGQPLIGLHLGANIDVRRKIGLELGQNLEVANQKRALVLAILTDPQIVEPARIVVAEPLDDPQHRPT